MEGVETEDNVSMDTRRIGIKILQLHNKLVIISLIYIIRFIVIEFGLENINQSNCFNKERIL